MLGGSYLYKFTIGRLGCLLGAPIFIIGYLYLAGIFFIVLFNYESYTMESFLNPVYPITTAFSFFTSWIASGTLNSDILYWMKFLSAATLPLFVFRLVKKPFVIIYKIIKYPFRPKTISHQERRQMEKEILKEELKSELEEEYNLKKDNNDEKDQ